ncbi:MULTISPECIES: hypothetical protein [Lactobacillus]|uniref:DUF5626 domain-containing protein n=2 Tax=Lactobacillus TaxID=1578 RepID=A0A6A8MD82_9LACO|nr:MULTISPECIES: hypothetical protein [Lactobacillus]MST79005.1 hypothetical protein [Lactobacillus equicursoris]MST86170.1 hypothetical protein [Lactobacillus porci]
MKRRKLFMLLGLIGMLAQYYPQSKVLAAEQNISQDNPSNYQTFTPSTQQNSTTVNPNLFTTQFNTVKGNLGVAKVWISGGEIYLLLKVTNPIFPVYHVTGTINVHYYATGKKRAYNRYFEFSGFGSLNKNWTYHHKYNTKRHGQVVVTGELNGNFGEISFPHTAF